MWDKWEKLKTLEDDRNKVCGKRAVLKRVYKKGYQEWPRLVLSIFEKNETITIGCSYKEKVDDCWKNISIPSNFSDVLAEMFEQYTKIKFKK